MAGVVQKCDTWVVRDRRPPRTHASTNQNMTSSPAAGATELRFDASPLISTIGEFASLLAEAGESAAEFREALVDVVQAGEKLVALEGDRTPATASELVVLAYPSDRFLSLLAAARAGNFDAAIVKQIFGHNVCPAGCSLSAIHR